MYTHLLTMTIATEIRDGGLEARKRNRDLLRYRAELGAARRRRLASAFRSLLP